MENFNKVWAEINVSNAKHNFFEIKKLLDKKVKLCCVVKADCYGHGAKILAPLFEKWGADYFAVSSVFEGIELRKQGITKPVLILGYTPLPCVKLLCKYDLSQCVYSKEYANLLLLECEKLDAIIKIHLKIDTGMGRLGFVCKNKDFSSLFCLLDILKNKRFVLEGVFSHFACSDLGKKGRKYTLFQRENFLSALNFLKSHDITFPICHLNNSGGIVDYKNCEFNMVRAGIVLYGLLPSKKLLNKFNLKPVMQLKSVISNVKTIKRGDKISYSSKFVAKRTMKVATVSIGYADGFLRSNFKNGYKVLVKNKPCKIVGNVCMDQIMIDVSKTDCNILDEVLIFGNDKNCSADNLAKINKTINYEIVCSVGKRVPRLKRWFAHPFLLYLFYLNFEVA